MPNLGWQPGARGARPGVRRRPGAPGGDGFRVQLQISNSDWQPALLGHVPEFAGGLQRLEVLKLRFEVSRIALAAPAVKVGSTAFCCMH
jgi:hypothetical protein